MPVARPLGFVQFVCPDCGYGHGSVKLNWRNGRIKCHRCRRGFVVGLNFQSVLSALPPFNAHYMPTTCIAAGVNRANATGQPMVGRVVGVVQWTCPTCDTTHGRGAAVGWEAAELECSTCHSVTYIGLLFYRAPAGAKALTPPDWIPEYVVETTTRGAIDAQARSEGN